MMTNDARDQLLSYAEKWYTEDGVPLNIPGFRRLLDAAIRMGNGG